MSLSLVIHVLEVSPAGNKVRVRIPCETGAPSATGGSDWGTGGDRGDRGDRNGGAALLLPWGSQAASLPDGCRDHDQRSFKVKM